MLVTGLSNTGGSGGSTLSTLLLLIFFNYSENKAVMIAYALVFGGSLGNFVSTGFGTNPKTGKPYINYDVILLSMPLMLLGSSIGVVLNRMVAPVLITIGLVIVMLKSVGKIYKKAKKEFKEELTRPTVTVPQIDNSPGKRLKHHFDSLQQEEDIIEIDDEWKTLLREDYRPLPKKKLTIVIALLLSSMIIAVIKGTKKLDSIVGLEYCGSGYWITYGIGMLSCLVFFFLNRRYVRKSLKIREICQLKTDEGDFHITDAGITKLGKSSVIAGILAGLLGMGGGTVMGPVLLSMDANIEHVVATSGFFVVQTSFMTLFQSSLYGDTKPLELLFFFSIAFTGSYGISYVLNKIIKKFKRPSLVLFILVFIFAIGLVAMPAFEVYKSFYDLKEMLTFSPLC